MRLASIYPRAEFNIPTQAQLERFDHRLDELDSEVGPSAKALNAIASSRVDRAVAAFNDEAELTPNLVVSDQMDGLLTELTDRCAPADVSFPNQ